MVQDYNLTKLCKQKTKTACSKMSQSTFEIIVGTYEEYLLGYLFSSEQKTLVQSFASHDHSGSIRCLATCGNYLASGATDDRVIVYDLKARKEHCMLTHHESTISSLAFTNNHSHVISASLDGSLSIVRVGNWQVEKLWTKAHKEGTILDIALHSSGKLALTLGTDGTIHTWNLVKGRVAYVINLKTKCKDTKSLEKIQFAPDDTKFLIFGGKFTEIWSIEVGGVLDVIEHDEKVTCCVWLDNETLFVGYEDGNLGTINLESKKKKIKLGHDGRVKAVQVFEGFIVTASSTGELKVWSRKLKEICKISTGCRITCLIITKWAGKIEKEEDAQVISVEEAPKKRPVRGNVVVEVDDSSEECERVEKAGKKRKKGQGEKKKSKKPQKDVEEITEELEIENVMEPQKSKKKNQNNLDPTKTKSKKKKTKTNT
ncbi:unnamed protein product [Ceutorhynchus assimilis]|uniref:P21-activated protein kinase-interacting protein 1-like n=1 Tax=Ceutorhynchus assimilis TaxID=467358 RepID=A0A9N9MXE9_9CUCU|nr:unnamed protein product [Ceutorhynchus assimilis]